MKYLLVSVFHNFLNILFQSIKKINIKSKNIQYRKLTATSYQQLPFEIHINNVVYAFDDSFLIEYFSDSSNV
nr:MAG TPA: hypothetical protein [Caudoviricetes sp.]